MAAESLDATTVTASPIDLFTERTADKVEISDSADSFTYYLQKQNGVQTRANGSQTLSIRGSLAADRTLTLFGFAPIQVGDGSGPAYVLLGDEIFDTLYIYKGPASLFFGSKATGGAFRLLPKPREKNRIRLTAASFDQFSTDLQVTAVQHGDHHLQFTYFAESFNNSYDHDSGLGYTDGRWRPNDSDWHRASATYFYKNSYTSVLFGDKKGMAPPALGFGANEYDQTALFATHYNELELTSYHSINGQISYLTTENKNWQSGTHSKIENAVGNAVLNVETLISPNFINLIQVQWTQSRLRNQYTTTTRYDHEEIDFGLQLVHSALGLQIEPQVRYLEKYKEWIKGLSISKNNYYAAYTEGFRNPTLNALYLDDTFSASNSNLKPEHSKQIEIGKKEEQYQVKVYRMDYEDMFKYIFNGTKYQTINEDKASTQGLEFEATSKDINYDLKFSLNYMRSKDSVGDPLPLSPRLQALYSISYYYGIIEIQPQLRTWYKYYLYDFTNGLQRANNWTTSDLYLHSFGFKDWKVTLGVENIFAKQKTFDVGYPEPLRRYMVQYQYLF